VGKYLVWGEGTVKPTGSREDADSGKVVYPFRHAMTLSRLRCRRGVRVAPPLLGLLAALAISGRALAAGTIVKGPWVQRVTSISAVVRVEVDPPAPVSVELGGVGGGDAGARVFDSSEAKSLHAITLTDLEPGTRYSYAVRTGKTSKLAAFITAPREDSAAPFRFLVYGDNRSDDAAHAAVVRAMVPVASEFILHTGDFVEDGASAAQWQNFFEIEAPLLITRSLFSCVGNHELTDGSGIQYARYFGPTDPPTGAPTATKPEHLNGTFRWGNTRFFLLNGMVSFRDTPDRAWLEEALKSADTEPGIHWRIAVVHHGPWSSGPHGANTRLHDAGIPALLAAHKVDMIISGHDHIYERGWADGMAYIVSGGGGAPVYQVKSPIPQARKVEAVRHFVEVGVSRMALQIVAVRWDGSTIERCSLHKGVGWDCDEDASSTSADSGRAAPSGLAGDVAPTSTSRCSCEAVGRRTTALPALEVFAAAAAVALALRRRSSPA
jgi:predicted phosphodiesterase